MKGENALFSATLKVAPEVESTHIRSLKTREKITGRSKVSTCPAKLVENSHLSKKKNRNTARVTCMKNVFAF